MIYCPNCGKALEDDTRFCDECGTSLAQQEATASEAVAFTEEPAVATTATTEEPEINTWAQPETTEENKKPAIPVKLLIMAGAAIVAVILVIWLLVSLLGGGSKPSYILYLKDDEMFYSDAGSIEPWQITADMYDGKDSSEYGMMYGAGGLYVTVSEDGKIIFYPDKGTNESALYYRYTNSPKKDAVKIDSDVSSYMVNEKANKVVYLKGDGTLYSHDLKDKEKIASDIDAFTLSPDGDIIYYVNDEASLYIKEGKKDAEKIDSEIISIEFIAEDYETLYYEKEDSLYIKKAGKDKEKLISDFYGLYQIYEDGSLYFTKQETEKTKYSAYVEDDMKDQDAAMVEPVYPDYPTYPAYPYSWNYASDAEYQAALDAYNTEYDRIQAEYDAAVDAYYENIDAWYAKENRDEIREYIEENTVETNKFTLYYYDGKEEKLVCESVTGINTADEEAVITYTSVSSGEIKKQKISELEYYWDIDVSSESASGTRYVAIKEVATEVDAKDGKYFTLTEDGSKLYFYNNINEEKDVAELYLVEISGSKVKAPELYDSDVSTEGFSAYGGNIYYYKSYNTEKDCGDLYKNKELVDYEVRSFRLKDEDSDDIYYITEYNSDKHCGTLKFYDGKAEKVADDVYTYIVLPSGDALYINDWSDKYYKGTLYIYDGKAEKVDDDVSAIFPVITTEDLSNMYSIYYESFGSSSSDDYYEYY